LLSQIKGYFYINHTLALSLAITIFSFAGIPPFIGFFAKQMILAAAIQNGFIFLALIGVITSVISAVYYLNIVKIMFFDDHLYKNEFKKLIYPESIYNKTIFNKIYKNNFNIVSFNKNDYILSNTLSITISIITLVILLFMFMPDQ
jgi:NADH-ubiquinone oxidoreductase chain 2